MKLKNIFVYATCFISIGFLGVLIFNDDSNLDNISAQVIDGDLNILGDNKYFYKDSDYKNKRTRELILTSEGIETIDSEYERDLETLDYNNDLLKLGDSDSVISNQFYKLAEDFQGHTAYININELIAGKREANSKDTISLNTLYPLKDNKIVQKTFEFSIKDILTKEFSLDDFSVCSIKKIDNNLHMVLEIFSYNPYYKKYIYIDLNLENEKYEVKELKNVPDGVDFIFNNKYLYIKSNDIVSEFKLNEEIDFNKELNLYAGTVYSEDTIILESGISDKANIVYTLALLKNGKVNLSYFNINERKRYEYQDLNVFEKSEIKYTIEQNAENNIKISQIFFDDGKLFIGYNYQTYVFDAESYMKVVDLKTKEVKLTLKTNLTSGLYRSSDYGKIID